MTYEPEVPEKLVREAAAFTDTAIVTFCRFSGEGWDRKAVLDEEGYELFGAGEKADRAESEAF